MIPNKTLKWFIVVGEIQSAQQNGFTYLIRPLVDERKAGHYELSISCTSGHTRRGIHDKYSDLIQVTKELAQAHADTVWNAIGGLLVPIDNLFKAYGKEDNYELHQIEEEVGALATARKEIE